MRSAFAPVEGDDEVGAVVTAKGLESAGLRRGRRNAGPLGCKYGKQFKCSKQYVERADGRLPRPPCGRTSRRANPWNKFSLSHASLKSPACLLPGFGRTADCSPRKFARPSVAEPDRSAASRTTVR